MSSNTDRSNPDGPRGSLVMRLIKSATADASFFSIAAALFFGLQYVIDQFGESISAYFISTVHIRSSDETFDYMMSWMAKHRLTVDNHRLAVSTASRRARSEGTRDSDSDDESSDDNDDSERLGDSDQVSRREQSAEEAQEVQKPRHGSNHLKWTPAAGTHYFRYRGRFLALTRAQNNARDSRYPSQGESLAISCLGRNADVLKDIVAEAEANFINKEKGRTHVYRAIRRYGDIDWMKTMSRPSRPMDTVVLDPKVKNEFIRDVGRYLRPQTKQWYAARGIPYRRGYLLYGPSGTGKTSLAFAIAGVFGLRIYTISLNSPKLTEDNLAAAFLGLPRRCVLLLEDIDAAGMTVSRTRAHRRENGPSSGKTREKTRISLSALLNVIDGVAAHEGRVLIMTSNHKSHIDSALLRPGRVDFMIQFELANFGSVVDIFTRMYTYSDNGSGYGPDSLDRHGLPRASKAPTVDELHDLATVFAGKIPESMLSPAEIQGFILKYPDSPHDALDAVDEWVRKTLDDKAAKESELEASAAAEPGESYSSDSASDSESSTRSETE